MITERSQLVERTYKRDGQWYTLAVIDRTNQVERLATEEEIENAAIAEPPTADHDDEPPKRKPGRPRKDS